MKAACASPTGSQPL
jgi:hypothetical protein